MGIQNAVQSLITPGLGTTVDYSDSATREGIRDTQARLDITNPDDQPAVQALLNINLPNMGITPTGNYQTDLAAYQSATGITKGSDVSLSLLGVDKSQWGNFDNTAFNMSGSDFTPADMTGLYNTFHGITPTPAPVSTPVATPVSTPVTADPGTGTGTGTTSTGTTSTGTTSTGTTSTGTTSTGTTSTGTTSTGTTSTGTTSTSGVTPVIPSSVDISSLDPATAASYQSALNYLAQFGIADPSTVIGSTPDETLANMSELMENPSQSGGGFLGIVIAPAGSTPATPGAAPTGAEFADVAPYLNDAQDTQQPYDIYVTNSNPTTGALTYVDLGTVDASFTNSLQNPVDATIALAGLYSQAFPAGPASTATASSSTTDATASAISSASSSLSSLSGVLSMGGMQV